MFNLFRQLDRVLLLSYCFPGDNHLVWVPICWFDFLMVSHSVWCVNVFEEYVNMTQTYVCMSEIRLASWGRSEVHGNVFIYIYICVYTILHPAHFCIAETCRAVQRFNFQISKAAVVAQHLVEAPLGALESCHMRKW